MSGQRQKVWVQDWEESESGWGTRPDGFTIHRTREAAEKYVKKHEDAQAAQFKKTGVVPHEYTRTSGTPRDVWAGQKTLEQLDEHERRKKGGALWGGGRVAPDKLP